MIDAALPIVVVVTDRECAAESVARSAGIAVERVERRQFGGDFDRRRYTEELSESLERRGVGTVAMAGFGTILSPSFFEIFAGRVLNTHPSLLPRHKGWHAVSAALEAGDTETGCTVHIATAEVDDGTILAQERVPIEPGDTEEALHERIKQVERRLYPETIMNFLGSPAIPGTDQRSKP
jgi:phosphoribosylglycinamide formyltransferase-1